MLMKLVARDNEILKQATKPVGEINDGIKALVECMIDTLRKTKGVGLSANQIGSECRIAVIEAPKFLKGIRIMINPEITWKSEDTSISKETCLSLPQYSCSVKRHNEVIVAYINKKGMIETLKAKGMVARIVQHEMDHLDGVLICDRTE